MFNGNYTQNQLPAELFNGNGDVNYNGMMYHVNNHGNGTRDVTPFSPQEQALSQAKAVNQAQIEANQPAIATLQAQGTSLADQYKTLLADVTRQGDAAFNTATSGENAFLGARGLLSQAGKGNNELSQAQNTVNTTNAANEQSVTTAGANAQVPIASAVASLQAGNLPNALTFSQNEQTIPSQIALAGAQTQQALTGANYISIPNLGVYDIANKSFVGGGAGASPSALTGVNGLFRQK